MKILMMLVGCAGFLFGVLLFASGGAQGAIHEIEGLLLMLIGTVGCGLAGVMEALHNQTPKVAKSVPSPLPQPPREYPAP